MAVQSDKYAEIEAKRKAEEEAMMNEPFELNGTKLKIKDMFPDCWAAKDFVAKLRLMRASKGGSDMLDTSPASIMDEAEGEAD